LKGAASAVRRIDKALALDYSQAAARWKEDADRAAQEKKGSKPGPPPRPRRIDIDDITMEALPLILADNSRGLVMIRDELTALLMGMNQFKGGKGNDRAVCLKIWSGDAIKKDRVGHEANVPIRCPHPSLSIVGGLTPDMLGSILDPQGRADGFIDRFLFTYPDPMPVAEWSDRGIPEETVDDWCVVIARIWQRPMNVKEGDSVPHVAHFSPEGKATWEDLYNVHAEEMNAGDLPPNLRGTWGKFREYAGRFALILACLEQAADPTADPFEVPSVGPRIVENAWRLVDYFKSHARRVHATISANPESAANPVAKAIVEWLRSGSRSAFSERDIKQARRWIEPEQLTEALACLKEQKAIRPFEVPESKPKGGRPSSPVYEVNPALLNTHNSQNSRKSDSSDEPDGAIEGSESSVNEYGGKSLEN
jgi:hypothetical protein